MNRFLLAAFTALVLPCAVAHEADPHARHADRAPAAEAFGRPGEPAKAARTVAIAMSDAMRFDPSEVHVKTGDTVRFVVTNGGSLEHEFVLGTMKELRAHAELMKRFAHMQHEEAYMATVAPGGRQTIVWQFTRPGEFHFACLEPGHLEAGMIGKVVVSAR